MAHRRVAAAWALAAYSADELRHRAQAIANEALRERTYRVYNRYWNEFTQWCYTHERSALPASIETLLLYYQTLAKRPYSRSALDGRRSAIKRVHARAGQVSPTDELPCREYFKAMKRSILKPIDHAEPLKPNEVESLRRPIADGHPVKRLIELRNRAMVLLGFAACLRRDELKRLRAEYITPVPGRGLLIRDLRTELIEVTYGSHVWTCPVRNLQSWLQAAHITTGPVFRRIDNRGVVYAASLSGAGFYKAFKAFCAKHGLNPKKYRLPSLRRGFLRAAHRRLPLMDILKISDRADIPALLEDLKDPWDRGPAPGL